MRFVKPPALPALGRYRPRRLCFPSFWAVLDDDDSDDEDDGGGGCDGETRIVRQLTRMTSVTELAIEPHAVSRVPGQSRVPRARQAALGDHPGRLAVSALAIIARDMPQLRRLTLYGRDVTIEGLTALPPNLVWLRVSGIARDLGHEWITALARRVPALVAIEIDQGFEYSELARLVRSLPKLRRISVLLVTNDQREAAFRGVASLVRGVASFARGTASMAAHATEADVGAGTDNAIGDDSGDPFSRLETFETTWRSRPIAFNGGVSPSETELATALWARFRLPNATHIRLGDDSTSVPGAVIMAVCGFPSPQTELVAAAASEPAKQPSGRSGPTGEATQRAVTTATMTTTKPNMQPTVSRTSDIETLRLAALRVSADGLTRMIAADHVHHTCHTLEFAMPLAIVASDGGGHDGDSALHLAPLRHFSALTDLTLHKYRGARLPKLPTLHRLTVDVEFPEPRLIVRAAVAIAIDIDVAAESLPGLVYLAYRGESACSDEASGEELDHAHQRSRDWVREVARHMPRLREVDLSRTAHIGWTDIASLVGRLPRLYRVRLDDATRCAMRGQLAPRGAPVEMRNPWGLERLQAAATAANVALV